MKYPPRVWDVISFKKYESTQKISTQKAKDWSQLYEEAIKDIKNFHSADEEMKNYLDRLLKDASSGVMLDE